MRQPPPYSRRRIARGRLIAIVCCAGLACAGSGAIASSSAANSRFLDLQAGRVDAALSKIPPSGNRAEIYFLGFAGVAEQRVFAGEIELARERIESRYRTGPRHLELINDARDRDSAPIASLANLRRALQGIAKRMHTDRDILIIALSSHGSSDPQLAVSNGTLPLRQIRPGDLRDALRDAGVVWKVVIISSCFAGGFIPSLEDEHSIVLAAAAADRTSFGCTNDRDLTYFGEAFYRDALPRAATLHDAFMRARKAIGRREHRERMRPSRPTAFFGAALRAKLEPFEPALKP